MTYKCTKPEITHAKTVLQMSGIVILSLKDDMMLATYPTDVEDEFLSHNKKFCNHPSTSVISYIYAIMNMKTNNLDVVLIYIKFPLLQK